MNSAQTVSLMNLVMARNIERHQIRAKMIRENTPVPFAVWYQQYDGIPGRDGELYHSSDDTNIFNMCREALREKGWWF